MKTKKNVEDISIKLTSFFMKCVGLWTAENELESRLRRIALSYTIVQTIYAIYIEGRDMIYTWSSGDFVEITYIGSNMITVVLVVLKVHIIRLHKDEFIKLIVHAKKHFWHSDYDDYERKILKESGRTCAAFICIFTFFAQCTLCGYLVNPILANAGKNESERILPFNMWLNLPLAYSPYFEIVFVSQTMALYHIGVGYFCFDNCLCLLCLYSAGQFRILQYRLSKLSSERSISSQRGLKCVKSAEDTSHKHYTALKDCIRLHQSLIDFCERMEVVFSELALVQVVLFSLLICLVGYQIILAVAPLPRRLIFTFHALGSLSQLMMFTYSCGYLMEESSLVSTAAYSAPWPSLSMDKAGANLRNDLILTISRAQHPCCLTACGFFSVSLETYTGVMSTAASYFTLLQRTETGIQ